MNLSLGVLWLVNYVNWLTLVENFVCNEAYFKLYPVPDWEPMDFF